jgi:hypothetical protein
MARRLDRGEARWPRGEVRTGLWRLHAAIPQPAVPKEDDAPRIDPEWNAYRKMIFDVMALLGDA